MIGNFGPYLADQDDINAPAYENSKSWQRGVVPVTITKLASANLYSIADGAPFNRRPSELAVDGCQNKDFRFIAAANTSVDLPDQPIPSHSIYFAWPNDPKSGMYRLNCCPPKSAPCG